MSLQECQHGDSADSESKRESLLHPLLAMPTWASDFSFPTNKMDIIVVPTS